ncbi:hypothetical protein F4824DRAFT_442756 [Ustulina deusta]|nr:hypothetical protein F4824DRAFT_442756 [Ustulina deusta]
MMRGPKHMLKWSSLKEATDLCNSLFAECRNIPALAKDGRIENRELEFHRLLSHSKDRDSLAYHIDHRENDREAIFGLLHNIEETLNACLRIASDTQYKGSRPKNQTRDGDSASPLNSDRDSYQDLNSDASTTSDETSTTGEAATSEHLADLQLRGQKRYLDVFLDSLVRRLALVRAQAPELRPQFCEADLLFDESHYEELRRYLTTLVLVQPYELSLFNRLSRMGLTGVGIVARAWLTDVARLSAVQARLINGVMRRHHRITFATRFIPNSSSQSKYEDPNTPGKSLEAYQRQNKKWLETCDDSPLSTGSSDRLQTQPWNISPLAKSTEPSISARFSRIIPTQDYPPRPDYMAKTTAPNCPFCGDHLSNKDIGSNAAWRSHVADDLRPYTCISEQCETPMKFFLTSSGWLRHMTEEHSSWVCSCCKESRLEPSTFFTKHDFLAHRQSFHMTASDKGALEVNSSQFVSLQPSRNLSPMRCPLCNYRLNPVDIEFDDHIPEHIHSFSLQALPWDNEAFFASSGIKSSATDKECTNDLSSIANNFQTLPTASLKTLPSPKDSKKSEYINWTLEVHSHNQYNPVTWQQRLISMVSRRKHRQIRNLAAENNTFVLVHDHSILPRHWGAVESFVSEYASSKAALPNRIRLYFTSEPEVPAFTTCLGRRGSAAAELVDRVRIHRPTRSGTPFNIVQISSQPTPLPKINSTKVERWINSTPLGPTIGVEATLVAMDDICNKIKETRAEETRTKGTATTVMILTSPDWPINTWTSAFHGLADLISERVDHPDSLPIHIVFIMIGDEAQVDNTAIFDLWTDVLKSSISSSVLDDSISTQLDPDGHIVKMSGRLPDLDSVISRPASAAAKPTDRTKSVAVLESFPSYRLHWTSLRECLKVLFPAYDFGDVHEIESDGRYHFSVPRLLTSEEKDYIWRLARDLGNREHDSIAADEAPISGPTKTSFAADISRGRMKFLQVLHLGIAAPPDGPLHLGSIVADISTFEPLGGGKPPAALPSRTVTVISQDFKMQISSLRTDEHIELEAKQLAKIWFQPSHEDVLAAMGDPDVENFVQRRGIFVRPVVYMVTGFIVAIEGQTIKRQTQEIGGKGKGVAVEGITVEATTGRSYENAIQQQWEDNLVVGIRVHKIIRKAKSIAIREHHGSSAGWISR